MNPLEARKIPLPFISVRFVKTCLASLAKRNLTHMAKRPLKLWPGLSAALVQCVPLDCWGKNFGVLNVMTSHT